MSRTEIERDGNLLHFTVVLEDAAKAREAVQLVAEILRDEGHHRLSVKFENITLIEKPHV